MSRLKTQEPKLCSNCPLLSFLPIILQDRVSYTREKEQLTPHKICQLMRAFAKQHHLTSNACPYFSEIESMERYVYAKAAETR